MAAFGLQDRPQAARAGERDDRLVTQGAESYGLARCEWVLGVGRQDRRLAGHEDRLKAGRRALARAKAEEGGVEVACGQPVEQRVGLILDERQLNAGVLASERAD